MSAACPVLDSTIGNLNLFSFFDILFHYSVNYCSIFLKMTKYSILSAFIMIFNNLTIINYEIVHRLFIFLRYLGIAQRYTKSKQRAQSIYA